MSACISIWGEFGAHAPENGTFVCGRCGVEDWPEAMAEIARLVERLDLAIRMHGVQFERANRVTAESDEHLSRLIDAEQQLGRCICASGPNFEGPDETCGIHGRTYAYWVEGYVTVQGRLGEAVDERDLLRREVARLRETTHVNAPDLDALRMDLDEACPHGTEGHGGHAEGTCEVCDYAFATNAIVDEWHEKVRR